jgi:hypothetical protein
MTFVVTFPLLSDTLYRVIPFVFEIRSIIDWTCKKTSLEIGQWFCLEDIFSELYVVKCHVDINRAEGRKIGDAQKVWYKIVAGALLVVLLLIVMFFPLIYYSTMNPNTVSNNVDDIVFTVGIKGFPSMYQTDQFAAEVDLSHGTMLDITKAYRGVNLVQLYNTKKQVISLYSVCNLVHFHWRSFRSPANACSCHPHVTLMSPSCHPNI